MQPRRLKPTETLQEYFLAMRDLAHKGSLDESSLIDYVINGIPDSSNNKIILYGSNRNTSTPSDRTVHPISESSGQISANPMHIPITLAKIQFTALCDTGSQATIINDKTYRSIGSPPLHPSCITFSGIGRDKIHSIGFFQDFITIEDTTLPAKIYVVSDTSIHLDAIIVMDFLQQTEFTFGKQGIRLCNESTDDTLIAIANVFLQIPSPLWAAGSVRTACSMSPYATPSTSPADGSSVPTRSISDSKLKDNCHAMFA
ncbi:hypothetical protein HNY73_015168 [Argiope bruennichi]|uniref:Peptidase A2 domain-containing protein n=1 Tax=Argiope bruennichi TaxID=94029 RepID=A0A8T0ET63_ARGBR|nr:hypothetical protein HNY73_015168 [Argiope bruennichi]